MYHFNKNACTQTSKCCCIFLEYFPSRIQKYELLCVMTEQLLLQKPLLIENTLDLLFSAAHIPNGPL